jgi:hypothetical protein
VVLPGTDVKAAMQPPSFPLLLEFGDRRRRRVWYAILVLVLVFYRANRGRRAVVSYNDESD